MDGRPVAECHAQSWLGIPLLRHPSGDPVGVLALDKYQPAYFTGLQAAYAVVIAPFIADRIAQVHDYLQRWIRANRLAALQLLNGFLCDAPAGDAHTLRVTARLVADAFGMAVGIVQDVDGEPNLRAYASTLQADAEAPPAILDRLRLAPISDSPVELEQFTGALCIPILLGGRRVGWLCGWRETPRSPFDEEDVVSLRGIANILAPALAGEAAGADWLGAVAGAAPLQDLLNTIQVPALCENAAGQITFVNQALLALLGYDSEDLVDRHYLCLVPDKYRDAVQREWAKRSQGIASQYRTILLAKDGAEIPVKVDARPRNEDGDLKHVLVSFTQAVVDQPGLRLFEALARATRSLRDESAGTPNQVLRAIRAELKACDLEVMILQLDADDRHLRVRDTSVDRGLLRRIRRVFGVYLLGLECDMDDAPHWREVVHRSQPNYLADGRVLIEEMAQPFSGLRAAGRLADLLEIGPAILVPLTDASGVRWLLGVWGHALQPEDIAPITMFWREAADALQLAETQLRDLKLRVPNRQLYHARHALRPWLAIILEQLRRETGSDSVALFGVNSETGVTTQPSCPSAFIGHPA